MPYPISATTRLTTLGLGKTSTVPRFSLVSSGLLFSEDFNDLNSWVNESSAWTVQEVPSYVAYPTGSIFLPVGSAGASDDGTIRQLGAYRDSSGVFWIYYDATDAPNFNVGTTMGVHVASSSDGGKTWTRHGRQLNPSGGFWGRLNGFVFKEDSTYYLYSLSDNPNGNGDAPPYLGSIFTSSSLTGPWSFVRDFPGLGTAGQWDAWSHYGYSVVLNAGTYYAFIGAGVTGAQRIGYDTASSADGQFTKGGDTGLANAGLPENPKVWWDSVLNKWCMLTNQVHSSGTYTDKNRMFFSSNLTDWSSATYTDIQFAKYGSLACTIDTTQGDIIGVAAPFYNFDKTVYRDGDFLPFVYDGLPSDGNHQGRKGLAGVLEPSRYCVQGVSTGGAARHLRHAISNGNFIAEFTFEMVSSSNGALEFYYRRDNSGAAVTNGYDLSMSVSGGVALYRVVSGGFTSIGSHATGLTLGRTHRIRVEVSGSNHKAYIDGVKVIDVNDATHASGAAMAFRVYNATARIRNFHVRSGNSITVNNSPSNVSLLTPGGIYVTEHQTSISHTHYPMRTLKNSTALTSFSGGIYGGDVYEYLT